MAIFNSYLRALIANSVIFIALVLKTFSRYQGPWSKHLVFLVVMEGFAVFVTTFLVGTFSSKSEKPWPWWRVGFVSLGCLLVVSYIMLFFDSGFRLDVRQIADGASVLEALTSSGAGADVR